MGRTRARQKFDGDAVASSGNFNDAMVRNRRFAGLTSDRMEYWGSGRGNPPAPADVTAGIGIDAGTGGTKNGYDTDDRHGKDRAAYHGAADTGGAVRAAASGNLRILHAAGAVQVAAWNGAADNRQYGGTGSSTRRAG